MHLPQRHLNFMILVATTLALSSCGKLLPSKEQSAGDKSGAEPTVYPATVNISGTLSLDPKVDSVNGLAKNQTLEGAVVFIKGEPNTFVKTDANGAFSLDIKISSPVLDESTTQTLVDGNGLSLTEQVVPKRDIALVMWFTTPVREGESQARFGIKKDANLVATTPKVDLGNVGLNYTTTLQFVVKSTSNETPLTDCTTSVEGLGERIKSKTDGQGIYKVDYLPQDSYSMTVSCGGHDSKTFPVVIDAADEAWEIQDAGIIHLTPSVTPGTL